MKSEVLKFVTETLNQRANHSANSLQIPDHSNLITCSPGRTTKLALWAERRSFSISMSSTGPTYHSTAYLHTRPTKKRSNDN